MTNKEYLRQLWTIDREIAALMQEVDELRARAESIGSLAVDGERVKSSPSQDAKYTRYAEEIVDILDMVISKQKEYGILRKRITQSIDRMVIPEERIVLRRRYFLHQTWERIAEEMNADRATVIRWHGTALLHFKK